MKTILFAAELGNGLGHVAPLKAIADQLCHLRSDLRVVFSIADCVGTRSFFKNTPYLITQAPVFRAPVVIKSHSSSYAEILAELGYSRPKNLSDLLAAWDDLFDLINPDVLIADHSPTATLAARGRIPTVYVGNGYTMPPTDMPLYPALKVGMAPPVIQDMIFNNINDHLSDRSQPTLECLPELLKTEHRAVFTLPHLDPYGPIRHEPVLGSYHEKLKPVKLPEEPHIFLYAGGDTKKTDSIVQAIGKTRIQVSAYLGGTESAASQFLRGRGANVFEEPPELNAVLQKCTLVVSHGGSGLTNAALMVGRPQLIIPIHAESQITAGIIEQLGLGLAVLDVQKDEIDDKLGVMLQVRRFGEQAEGAAQMIAEMNLASDPLRSVVEQISGLILN